MQRRNLPGLAAAAALGALAGWFLHAAAGGPAASDSGEEADAAALRARVADLERENSEMRRRADANRARRRAESDAIAADIAKPAPSEVTVPDADGAVKPRATDIETLLRGANAKAAGDRITEALQGANPGAARPQVDVSGDPRSLLQALRAASERGDEASAGLLQAALIANGAASVDPLMAVVRDTSTPPALAMRALATLAALNAPGLAGLAEEMLQRGGVDASVRAAALGTAVAGDPAGALPLVQRLLASGDAADVEVARNALPRARDRSYIPLLAEEARRTENTGRMTELVNTIAALKDRRWSALQLTGEPDTPAAMDLGTAWASKGAEMGLVWIEVDYADAVVPDLVRIRETLAAGAVVKIEARLRSGWQTLWEGAAAAAETPRWFEPPLAHAREAVGTIRITLDTDKVENWNEIDAVELVGGGRRQWATGARASSSYAD